MTAANTIRGSGRVTGPVSHGQAPLGVSSLNSAGVASTPVAPAASSDHCCGTCGKPLVRRPKERADRFRARRYCSPRCASEVGRQNYRAKAPAFSKEELAPLVAQGLSLTEIGARIGKDFRTVWRLLKKHGLKAAGKPGRRRPSRKQREMIDQWKREARQLYAPRVKPPVPSVKAPSVEEFLARGGQITRCPPAYCAASDQYR